MKTKKGLKYSVKNQLCGGLTGVLWWDESLKIDEVPKRIKMNAGCTDGHVESYYSNEKKICCLPGMRGNSNEGTCLNLTLMKSTFNGSRVL